mmetsp:Transcript_19339/g.31260  ORF Transcript_19339/g.31260 Transcript_19339/m.31260 type:complete len:355 (+) Transcript_19339:51-1115(+)
MPPSMKTLGLWFVYLLGFATIASVSADDPSSDMITVKTELLAQAVMHAKSNMQEQDQLVENLMNGDIDALYSVAVDMNADTQCNATKEDTAQDDDDDDDKEEGKETKTDDQLTSMMIWHSLADGPAKHAPSALALGHSYKENKKRALQYFAQASSGSTSRRTAMEGQYNSGQVATELEEYSVALDFYRKCHANANAAAAAAATASEDASEEEEEDNFALEMSKKCKTEYKILSSEIRGERMMVKGGVTGVTNMFQVASLDGFPQSETPAFKFWSETVEQLKNYETTIRKAIEEGDMNMVMEGAEMLYDAQDNLDDLISTASGGDGMSQLQEYLVGKLNMLIKSMVRGHEGHDEF